MSITREIYESFQRGELKRWDVVVSTNVLVKRQGLREPVKGIEGFKNWESEFLKALEPRVDLIDEYEGSDRAFIAVNLNWKHVKPFFNLQPTCREGTSFEYFIFKIENGKVTEFQVADASLDMALYLWDRGWPQAHGLHPVPIVKGIDR